LLFKQNQLEDQINYLLSQFPKDIYLTKLEYSKNELNLIGQTLNPTLIRSFYSQLQQDKRFTDLSLESVKKIDEGFVFKMKLGNFK
jgi:Tfp pilus assembly protein PilN